MQVSLHCNLRLSWRAQERNQPPGCPRSLELATNFPEVVTHVSELRVTKFGKPDHTSTFLARQQNQVSSHCQCNVQAGGSTKNTFYFPAAKVWDMTREQSIWRVIRRSEAKCKA